MTLQRPPARKPCQTPTAGTPFIIDITSQDAPANTAGPADNFNAALDYDLLIADTILVTGFDPSFFDLQTANFQNNLLGGMFGIELRTNNQIFLTFRAFDAGGGGPSMPVPEPASVVVWSLAGMALAAWARRRRQ